eukprot:COSAG05_NODE_5124_length_1258_cov_9.859362_1_plen_287_part_10
MGAQRQSKSDRLVGAGEGSDLEPLAQASGGDDGPSRAPLVPTGLRCCCGGTLTPNAKVLLVAMVLFVVITVLQVFAAVVSNSAALMADCISMGVDALSYGGNAVSEVWPSANRRRQERNQLVGAGISLALLAYFTSFFLLEAASSIADADGDDHSCCDAGHEDSDCWVTTSSACANASRAAGAIPPSYEGAHESCLAASGVGDRSDLLHLGTPCVWSGVDPTIVFVFALFGLLFDLVSLLAFKRWGGPFASLLGGNDSAALNMSSALLHVLSDCLRSSTTLMMSILI